jgi:hypothetical protein
MTSDKRPIKEIARAIRDNLDARYRDKPKPPGFYYHSRPYLDAACTMNTLADSYYLDNGRDIVLRLLGNLETWRGDAARQLKAELREHLQ